MMTGLTAGQEVTINPQHPFYGGVQGVFEFTCGKKDEILVFSKPRQSEDEVKIFFMLRPEDYVNAMRLMMEQLQPVSLESLLENPMLPEIDEDSPPRGGVEDDRFATVSFDV